MKLSEDNALKSVPALPANDHLHMRCNLITQLLLLAIFLNESFFLYVYYP